MAASSAYLYIYLFEILLCKGLWKTLFLMIYHMIGLFELDLIYHIQCHDNLTVEQNIASKQVMHKKGGTVNAAKLLKLDPVYF